MTVTIISTLANSNNSFELTSAGPLDYASLFVLRTGALIVDEAAAITYATGQIAAHLSVDGAVVSGARSANAVLLPTQSSVVVGAEGSIRGVGNSGFTTLILGADLEPGGFQTGLNRLVNGGQISAIVGAAVEVRGTSSSVDNAGHIIGGQGGVMMTGGLGKIANTGTISATGGPAIRVENATLIHNSGIISSASFGYDPAIQLNGPGSSIRNSGVIENPVGAIFSSATAEGDMGFRVTNSESGRITGSIQLNGVASDTVVNRGVIDGSVALYGGNDIFDGRGGTLTGTVLGGAGNDTFRLSDASTTILEYSGDGTDLVQSTVDYTLQDFVENLTLLGVGDLQGRGNAEANLLRGNSGDNRLWGAQGNDTVSGLDGDDILNGGAGNDSLSGGTGDDTILGGAGNDRLSGGEDADRFVFHLSSESPATSGGADLISDFRRGEDLIVLTRIDARAGTAANEAFTFIGTAAFSNVEGQLRVVVGGTTQVQADINGDGKADMIIRLTGSISLTAADFAL
jgi:Ca2+-binding RTX toxin-like protein